MPLRVAQRHALGAYRREQIALPEQLDARPAERAADLVAALRKAFGLAEPLARHADELRLGGAEFGLEVRRLLLLPRRDVQHVILPIGVAECDEHVLQERARSVRQR